MALQVRGTMTTLHQQGFSVANMRPWRWHWDRQLYKALEHQYQMGLESLNSNLNEIKIEVSFGGSVSISNH